MMASNHRGFLVRTVDLLKIWPDKNNYCHSLPKRLEIKCLSHALEKVCDLLPSTLRTDCDDFVQFYGDKIIDTVLQGVGPKVICTFLGLCAGEAKLAAPASSIERNLCKDVLACVKQIVGENTTEKYIVDALDKVCNFLPAPLKDECDVFVKQYGSEVVQLIDNDIDPQKICNELNSVPPAASLLLHGRCLQRQFAIGSKASLPFNLFEELIIRFVITIYNYT